MKKMMMVLMVLMMAVFVGCATTSPVDTEVYIDCGDWFITAISDSTRTPTYFDEYSDNRKVEIYKSLAPEEINGKHLVYDGFEFHKVSPAAEKYYTYFFVKKDETYMVLVNNLGDGRELRLYYHLKDIVE